MREQPEPTWNCSDLKMEQLHTQVGSEQHVPAEDHILLTAMHGDARFFKD